MLTSLIHRKCKATHRAACRLNRRAVIRLSAQVAGGKLPSPPLIRWIYRIDLPWAEEARARLGSTERIIKEDIARTGNVTRGKHLPSVTASPAASCRPDGIRATARRETHTPVSALKGHSQTSGEEFQNKKPYERKSQMFYSPEMFPSVNDAHGKKPKRLLRTNWADCVI